MKKWLLWVNLLDECRVDRICRRRVFRRDSKVPMQKSTIKIQFSPKDYLDHFQQIANKVEREIQWYIQPRTSSFSLSENISIVLPLESQEVSADISESELIFPMMLI